MASHVTPAYNRAYYLAHRERIKARVQKYREAHQQKIRKLSQENYKKNRSTYLRLAHNYKINSPAWKRSWRAARERCLNPKNRRYRYYGGRGIRFLLTWEEIQQLAVRDQAEHMRHPTLDRINVHGNYEVNNCQFLERADNTAKSWRDTPIRVWGHLQDFSVLNSRRP